MFVDNFNRVKRFAMTDKLLDEGKLRSKEVKKMPVHEDMSVDGVSTNLPQCELRSSIEPEQSCKLNPSKGALRKK